MINLKQLLAENMVRFRTKNLSEVATTAGNPPSLTLNYDNGMLRSNELFGTDGNLIWDLNITFTGGPGGLTATQVVLIPDNSADLKPGAKALAIPLLKSFTVLTPLDFKNSSVNNKTFQDGIKLNLKSPNAVATGLDAFKLANLNAKLGRDTYTALSNLAVTKGWYTGPKKTVAKQYTLFTNHDGSQNMY